jgi:hypothetical protein
MNLLALSVVLGSITLSLITSFSRNQKLQGRQFDFLSRQVNCSFLTWKNDDRFLSRQFEAEVNIITDIFQ